ncbi:unnamed protein product [Moneuplotes crassus]|uniref:Uncharacterized protein n=1 Tax=Euplotes crassus TaxID=5936 RepID=A0AAD1XRY4_EUPCR|nr:unnamed protein product [Moneuplotes crassus]
MIQCAIKGSKIISAKNKADTSELLPQIFQDILQGLLMEICACQAKRGRIQLCQPLSSEL